MSSGTQYPTALPQPYTTPSFPSLYWPFQLDPGDAQYLDTVSDIWRFTTYWSLITICAAHFLVATWAILMQFASAMHRRTLLRLQTHPSHTSKTLSSKNRKLLGEHPVKDTLTYGWAILGFYLVVGAIEAFISGSLVGVVLGAVYDAGFFRMSTWTPFFWGIINMLVLIVASFRLQGGL